MDAANAIGHGPLTNFRLINYALLFAGCVLFHCIGTWSLPLIDRDEPRFAEAAREMRQRGDYIIPYFNNQYRFDKPPLTYWLQIVSYRLFGENDFAARFPTTVAAALTALVLYAWGTRLRDLRLAGTAALIFTLSLQTFIHAKAAVADMWLVLFVTIAHKSGWELLRDTEETSKLKYQVYFYLSLALAFLAKGPIGWTPLLTVIIARRFFPNARLNRQFRFAPGILLMLAIVCAWAVPALVRTGGEFFRVGIGKHVLARSLVPMEGHGASSPVLYLALLPFYFVTIFVSFFPWSVKLPRLIQNLRGRRDATDQFLIAGVLVVFLIFTFVQTKLPHYTLPALPLLALLTARRAEELRLTPLAAVSFASLCLLIALFVPPAVARSFPSYALSRLSGPDLKPQMQFAAVEYTEPSLVWYFRSRVTGFMTILRPKQAGQFMTESGPRLIILPTQIAADVARSADPSWRKYTVSGFNLAKGKPVELTLLLKPQ